MIWLSDLVLRTRIGAMALEDAEHGVYNGAEAVASVLGPEPRPFSPASNDEDRRLQHQRGNTTLRDELTEDRRARETSRANEASPLAAVPLAIILFLIESWASARVLLGIGVEATAALVLGVALAAGIFGLAGYCARASKRKLVYVIAVIAFALLIVSLTVLRMHEIASDDGDEGTDLASGIVLVVLSLGPAFLGELVLRQASAALRVRRDLRAVRRQLREEEQAIRSADETITDRANESETWRRQHTIALAEYRRVWDVTARRREIEEGRRTAPPAPSTHPALSDTTSSAGLKERKP